MDNNRRRFSQKTKAVALSLLWVAIFCSLYLTSLENYLLFHSLAELFSIVVGFAIFTVSWNTRDYTGNPSLSCLGSVYLCVAALDLAHTLSYAGMNIIGGYEFPANQLWIAARSLEALSLAYFLSCPGKSQWLGTGRSLLIATVLTIAALASIFWLRIFPVCYVVGEGQTAFKIGMEYLIMATLFASMAGLWRNRREYSRKVFILITASVFATVFSEFCFTLYVSNFDFFNFLGHFSKIVSFVLLYNGLVVTGLKTPIASIFKRLNDDTELQRRTLQIGRMGGWEKSPDGSSESCSGQFKSLLGLAESLSDTEAIAFAESQERLGEAMRKRLRDAEPFDIEFEAQRADGESIWLRACGWSEKEADGKLIRHFGMLHDISKAKESERLRDEVDRISQHDLKTPLNSVICLSGMMFEDKSLSATQRSHAKLINESGRRLLDMIGLSLDIFKMERGVYQTRPSELYLPHFLETVKEELDNIIRSKNLKMEFGFTSGDGAPYDVWAESHLCHSMLCNVLKNAVEAAPENTAINIQCSIGERDISTAIRNKGVPDQSIRKRFFEKYSTFGKNSGSGLGNYSARLIARTMGGDIEMDCSDTLDETTITIRLPRPPKQ